MRTLAFRLFTVFLSFTLIFFLLRILPGDYLEGQVAQGNLNPELAAAYREQLGIDQPLYQQYARNIVEFLNGNFGISLARQVPVHLLLDGAVQATFALALASLGLALIVGLCLGTVANSGYRLVTAISKLSTAILQGMPVYWVATWLILAVGLFVSPRSTALKSIYETQLPILALALSSSGSIARVTQTSLEQVIRLDAIRTARAKGLPRAQIFYRHILKLALPPILTVIGLQAGFLLSGTVIIEIIFARPGVGRVLYDAVLNRDYPVVQAVVVLSSIVYMAINLLLDWFHSMIDPRVRSNT